MIGPRARLPWLGLSAVAILVALASGWGFMRLGDPVAPTKQFPAQAERVVAGFAALGSPTIGDFRALVGYFVEGYVVYRTPAGSGAAFPGMHGGNGGEAEELEGFARSAVLMAAWLSQDRPSRLTLPSGNNVDLLELMRHAVLAGTDEGSPGYWGKVGHRDQRIVEASDVAIALWLTRDRLWRSLTTEQRARIGRWLAGVNDKETRDSNWHLFVITVNLVLRQFGLPYDEDEVSSRYARIKHFYRGDGWFSDGPGGVFDYYNAWGFHYGLFWIDQVAPDFDRVFIRDALARYAATLKYLIGPSGFPIMGRSICYRLAISAPLLMAAGNDLDGVTTGEARRALDLTWLFFARHGAVRNGTVTQGYCASDPRILDPYSGPASCLWSLRSLVAAFYLPDNHTVWRDPPGLLPVERDNFRLELVQPPWTIIGDKASGNVTIYNRRVELGDLPKVESVGALRRAKSAITGRIYRPVNHAAKYDRAVYDSAMPFCGCSD